LETIINLEESEKVVKEFEVTVKRIKSDATRKALKELSEQIKLAEMEKDSKKVKKLTKRFERLSKGLL